VTAPHGVSAGYVRKNADWASIRAKEDGAETFCFSDGWRNRRVTRILELDLRQGAGQRGIRTFYQPPDQYKVRRDHQTCEAALRGNHPVRGTSLRSISFGAEDMGPDRRSRTVDFAQGLHGVHEGLRPVTSTVNCNPSNHPSATC